MHDRKQEVGSIGRHCHSTRSSLFRMAEWLASSSIGRYHSTGLCGPPEGPGADPTSFRTVMSPFRYDGFYRHNFMPNLIACK